MGGPLLWPAGEAWPTCSVPDEQEPSGEPAVAMVPVVQVYRRDVPGEWWPVGMDLLQILWCPNEHWEAEQNQAEGAPTVEVRWRLAEEVVAPDAGAGDRSGHGRHEEGLVPHRCTVSIESVADDVDRPVSRYDVWKIGGHPRWSITDPREIRCGTCDARAELLFTVSSGDVTGVDVGRSGELRIFACPADARHGVQMDLA